jgi:hypothetical protein
MSWIFIMDFCKCSDCHGSWHVCTPTNPYTRARTHSHSLIHSFLLLLIDSESRVRSANLSAPLPTIFRCVCVLDVTENASWAPRDCRSRTLTISDPFVEGEGGCNGEAEYKHNIPECIRNYYGGKTFKLSWKIYTNSCRIDLNVKRHYGSRLLTIACIEYVCML